MNDLDLEEALRNELRGRAEAIDREVSLIETVARRVRRIRRRRIAAASALAVVTSAVVTGAVISGAVATVTAVTAPSTASRIAARGVHYGNLGVVHGLYRPDMGVERSLDNGPDHGSQGRPTESAFAPAGWVPVAHQDVQVFVPATWLIEAGGVTCGRRVAGMVFFDQVPGRWAFKAAGCRPAANVVTLFTTEAGLFGPARAPNGVVHGLFVRISRDPDGTLDYRVSRLGAGVTARGPLAARVVSTLTRSPRSVVLAGGPRAPVPAGWRWHDFGGIKFAAPAGWALKRDSWWGGCRSGIAAATVRLSTAGHLSAPGCDPQPSITAGSQAARPGVVVGAGRYIAAGYLALNVTYGAALPQCLRLRGMQACVLPSEPDDTLLQLVIRPPGAATPILVQIGLAGTGGTARAILDSIRPAPISAPSQPQLPRLTR